MPSQFCPQQLLRSTGDVTELAQILATAYVWQHGTQCGLIQGSPASEWPETACHVGHDLLSHKLSGFRPCEPSIAMQAGPWPLQALSPNPRVGAGSRSQRRDREARDFSGSSSRSSGGVAAGQKPAGCKLGASWTPLC